MSERFTIRLATHEDVDAIAEHRARMFQEMGEISPDTFEILRAKSRERLRDLLTRGDRLVLHASEAGRSLYARLGFVRTNEMRLAGD